MRTESGAGRGTPGRGTRGAGLDGDGGGRAAGGGARAPQSYSALLLARGAACCRREERSGARRAETRNLASRARRAGRKRRGGGGALSSRGASVSTGLGGAGRGGTGYRGCRCAEGIVLGAGPPGSAAPLTLPPSLISLPFRRSASPGAPLPSPSLVPGCTASCFGGAGAFASGFGALCGKSLWARPSNRPEAFQKPTWFCWVQPIPFLRIPSAHPPGDESINQLVPRDSAEEGRAPCGPLRNGDVGRRGYDP